MMKNKLRSITDKLIKAYALKIFSDNKRVNIKTAQRLHNAFITIYDDLRTKYKDYDFASDLFWHYLEREAKIWWSKRGIKGTGIDW